MDERINIRTVAPGPLISEPTEDEIRAVLASRHHNGLDHDGFKMAAVLVPIFIKDGRWHVLLTRRTDTVDVHKGEISFPGGRHDPDDRDLTHTALREADEEVGLHEVKVLGQLDDIYTITGFRVSPFVGRLNHPFEVRPAPEEIAEIILLPLSSFMAPGRLEVKLFEMDGRDYPVYFFHVENYTVWGATAKILKQFLEVCLNFNGNPA